MPAPTSINGGEGGDLLIGADGNDTLDGGTAGRDPDFDWVSYSGATGAVTVNLGAGTATGDASVGSDVLLNIDGAFGSNYGDALTGWERQPVVQRPKYEWFQGNGGNDTIDGGRGTAGGDGRRQFRVEHRPLQQRHGRSERQSGERERERRR
jgi:Ca2+-binding RTX toxin-like protein